MTRHDISNYLTNAASVAALVALFFAWKGDHQSSITDAQARQKRIDALYQRLGNDEAAIDAIASQLPEDKRQILDAIQRAERRAAEQSAAVNYDKMDREYMREPVLAQRNMAPADAGAMAVKPMADAAKKAAKSVEAERPQ